MADPIVDQNTQEYYEYPAFGDHDPSGQTVMIIRDYGYLNGNYIEFWMRTGNGFGTTDIPWRRTVNGSQSSWSHFNLVDNGERQFIFRTTVTYTQTVKFSIDATHNVKIGGPFTLSVNIKRPSIPGAPSAVTISSITPTTARVVFTDGVTNGAPIDSRQIGYGLNSNTPQTMVASDKDTIVSGLFPGTTYYFWARTHNFAGWSAWSPVRSATTTATAHLNVNGVWKTAVVYVKAAGTWHIAIPWARGSGVWKEAR